MALINRAQAQGEELLAVALDLARQRWRDRLVAAYALGSLAHGGFSAASDIDIGLVLDDPLLGTDSEGVMELVASIKATDEVIEKLKNPEALARCDPKALTKLILFPVRFMFTARTGEVGRNEAAVEHFVAASESAASNLARLALEWRNAAPVASDRDAIQAIAAGVIPLYQEFLEDHVHRLREYGRVDLAEAFHTWRKRLQK